jgi:ribosomal protein L11 methyltransferase
MMTKLWAQVCYEVPDTLVEDISEFLLELSPDGVVTENLTLDTFSLESLEESPLRTVTVFFEANDALADKLTQVRSYFEQAGISSCGYPIREPTITYIREEDWSNTWKSHFKPSRIGKRIVVKPTWEEYCENHDDIVLELDPGMAFGTGTHPSTRLCMEVLEKIFFYEGDYHDISSDGPLTVLDVGTGSGILGIAAAKLGALQVTGIDIDPQAVAVAEENIAKNGVGKHVKVSDSPLEMVKGTYGVVVANILAEELVKMAPELVKKVIPGGVLILSGILTEKESIVVQGFSTGEMTLAEISREAEWSCLVFRRGN